MCEMLCQLARRKEVHQQPHCRFRLDVHGLEDGSDVRHEEFHVERVGWEWERVEFSSEKGSETLEVVRLGAKVVWCWWGAET